AGLSKAIAITVIPLTLSVFLSPELPGVPVGGTVQLTPRCTDLYGNEHPCPQLVWGAENPAIATVSQSGLVTGVDTGVAIITATLGSSNDQKLVHVVRPGSVTLTLTPQAQTVVVGGRWTLVPTLRDAAGNALAGSPLWRSSDSTVATVTPLPSSASALVG